MNVLDAILRIAVCWKLSTGEKFNMDDLIAVSVDSFGYISFCMRDGVGYRICEDSGFVEKFNVWKGWEKI